METPPSLDFEAFRDGPALVLRFAYHPRWVAAVKQLPRRRFEPESRTWRIGAEAAPEALARFEAAGAPSAWLDALRPHAEAVLAGAATRQARARAIYERALDGLEERHVGLFAHQRAGVEFLLRPRTPRGALLADEMGLGKTRQAIVAAAEAISETAGRVLVVCPASLKLNWAREIRLALGEGEPVAIVEGRWPAAPARWTIVNYDRLGRHQAAWQEENWDVLILDEAHYIKNRTSLRSRLVLGPPPEGPLLKAERSASRRAGPPGGLVGRAERTWLLTGTPVTNRPLDLFALLEALAHPLADDRLAYAVRYCAAFPTGFGYDMRGASHLDELHARLDDVLLRRVRDEVLDLPPKLRTYMPVEVDLDAYRQLWRDYLAQLAQKRGAGRRLGKRAILAEIAKLRHAAALAKIPAALAHAEAVLEAGEKLIVFSQYRGVIDALTAHFGERAVRLDGRDGPEARERAVERFQQEDAVGVFVGHLHAAGVGVSLTAASQVLFVDYSFVPADHLQAEDRPARIGQRHAVTVTYLSAVGTLDEEIEGLLAHKLAVVASTLDGEPLGVPGSFVDELLAIVARPPDEHPRSS